MACSHMDERAPACWLVLCFLHYSISSHVRHMHQILSSLLTTYLTVANQYSHMHEV